MNIALVILAIVVVGSLIGSGPWLLEKAGDLVEHIDRSREKSADPVGYAQRMAEINAYQDGTPV